MEKGLTNFNTLKKLLAPYEEQLKIPEGKALKDVTPVFNPNSDYTADCQRILQLGLNEPELNDLFGWDYTQDNFLFKMRDFEPEFFSSWHWFDTCDEDLAFLDAYT